MKTLIELMQPKTPYSAANLIKLSGRSKYQVNGEVRSGVISGAILLVSVPNLRGKFYRLSLQGEMQQDTGGIFYEQKAKD